MADLTTIGTFALCTGSLRRCGGRRRWKFRIVGSAVEMNPFALFTSKPTFLVLFQTLEYSL